MPCGTYDDLAEMCDFDAVRDFRAHALNPEHPAMRGSHENGDIFFQNREACNKAYDELPAVVEEYMKKVNEKLGTNYDLFNYYGAPDAERVIVAMGSICDVAEEVIDYLNAKGEKVGLVKVRLYRPFVTKKFVECLPETVKKIAVLDRTKEPGSTGEPLYLDVVDALNREGRTGILVYWRPLWPGQQRYAALVGVRHFHRARQGSSAPRVHRGHCRRRDQPLAS